MSASPASSLESEASSVAAFPEHKRAAPVEGEPVQPFIFDLPSRRCRKPLRKSGDNPTTSTRQDAEVEDAAQGVGDMVYELIVRAAKDIYHELLEGKDIAGFLKSEYSGYDDKSHAWVDLPREPEDESKLCKSFTSIMNGIIKYFYASTLEGVAREAVDSHDTPLVHDNGAHFTTPGICIQAIGPSFETPQHAGPSKAVGYTNTAAIAEVNDRVGKRVVHCRRLAVYHRQIFIQQPNRHFVRSLVLTEKMFRLVHHDCSGMYATPLFDVHKEASLLVQFIIGLASPNEVDIGLDTSVQWRIDDSTGKKASGTVAVNHEFNDNTGTPNLKT